MLLSQYHKALERLRFVLKPAITFEFWSTLIFMLSFVPASGWLLNRLVAASGQYAVTDKDLVTFFLSTQGILFLILSVGFVLAYWFAEQVGLLIISLRATFEKESLEKVQGSRRASPTPRSSATTKTATMPATKLRPNK